MTTDNQPNCRSGKTMTATVDFPHIAQLGPAFLSTPYRRYPLGPHAAYIHACCLAGKLMKAGITDLFVPICHAHGIAQYAEIDPYDNDFWLRAYAGHLNRSAV